MTIDRISRERLEAPPGQVYVETVLEPSYRLMVEHYFDALAETNLAWAVMLLQTGIITPPIGSRLLDALVELERTGREALSEFDPRYEYFYSHMEAWLIEHAGEEVAGEINIGRTRPEPLTRMALRTRLLDVTEQVADLGELLLGLAERHVDTVMPQWTHFQHAQLSTLGHYFVAIVDALRRDITRLLAAYETTNQCTLGCGALAGTSYPVDRELVARLLGFDGVRVNTIDAVSGGDHVLESTAAIGNLMITLSRLCEDLYIWHTEEFGFITVADEFAGSSSMMPQKKNPYPFEYIRARAAHAVGEMTSAYGTLHNTNYQDIKDVEEEIVPPALRTLTEASRSLTLLAGTIATMEVHAERMLERAGSGFAATTELAATIHRETELSARTAHRVVGNLVLRAHKRGLGGRDVDLALLQRSAVEVVGHELGEITAEHLRRALDPRSFVAAHDVSGGPAPDRVREAIAAARERVERDGRMPIAAARASLVAARGELDDLVQRGRSARA